MDQRYSKTIAILLACSVAVLALLRWQEQNAVDAALASYRAESADHARGVARSVERTFHDIYAGLRTMARLPGVRAVDRYGTSLSGDARTTVQEIYNNLASTVAMSEVYLLPRDFDPDAIDPATGQLQQPITTFDQLIVGRTGGDPQATEAQVEEIEAYEYRAMGEQLRHLQERYSSEAVIAGLEYPALASREVITCDNSRYDPARPDDADRAGLVYSVPFYDAGGQLKGMVSGVVLTRALRDLLPDGEYALYHRGRRYVAGSSVEGTWRSRLTAIREARPADGLLYSEVVPLAIADLDDSWSLWVGRPDTAFEARADVQAAHRIAHIGYGVTLLVTLLMIVLLRANHARARAVEEHAAQLELRVEERTGELHTALAAAETAALARSQFLTNMSHEIRTPINGMLGMNEVLLHSTLDTRQRRCAESIRDSGETLSSIIDGVLDLARIEAGALALHDEEFDLRALVEGLVASLAESAYAKGLTLHCDIAPALAARRRGDRLRLRQVLTHLLGNAIRFTLRGSVVVSVRTGAHPAELRFSVRDTGIGIAAADQRRIFDAFVQVDAGDARRYGGAGLGLSLSTGLVRLMGGTLTVDSEDGLGSDFRFTVRMPALAAVESLPPRGTLRALIVDDNAMDRSILAGYLGYCGCTVSAVESIDDALALTDRAGMTFDLLIHGYAGDAAQALASVAPFAQDGRRRIAHRLLVAPLRSHPDEDHARLAGVDCVWSKPLRFGEIRACVERLRGAAQPATTRVGAARERLTGRVLVAEDNPVNQEVARALLELCGLEVEIVADGAAAIDAWRRGRYDLVLMDCQMPGTSGYDATAAIRAEEGPAGRLRTPIVALTAHALEGDRERCLAAGMDDCLSKPFTDLQLRAVLARWLLSDAPSAIAARA